MATYKSKYCIEAKNEKELLTEPCDCYKKKLVLCVNLEAREFEVCRHWFKYLNDRQSNTFESFSNRHNFWANFPISRDGLPLDVFNLLFKEFDIKADLKVTRSYVCHDIRRRSPHLTIGFDLDELRRYRPETIRKRLEKDPYFYELVYKYDSKVVYNKIHITEFIKMISQYGDACYDSYVGYDYYRGRGVDHETAEINEREYRLIISLYKYGLKGYVNKCRNDELTEKDWIKIVSSQLINQYNKIKNYERVNN